MDGDKSGFAGCEMYALETCQNVIGKLQTGPAHRGLVEIGLRNLVSCHRSSSVYPRAHIHSAVRAWGRLHF